MVVIQVQQGQLRGTEESLYSGASYYSFKGIPYAQPPVGDLRFRDPQPPLSWNGVFDASSHGHNACQFDPHRKIIRGDEDCLYLNVYTRSTNIHSRIPVMVWIHGGAFIFGSGDSDTYGPNLLLEKNVVIVTINYRLEVFGFLCLDTPEVPGNAGLKDQVMAMKWVKENIEKFGGDPDDVTIFGESAGGVSVALQLVSPLARGLFHKVIIQSGSSIADWSCEPDGKKTAFQLGKISGKETTDENELFKFLQSIPASDLIGISGKFQDHNKHFPFLPVVEKEILGLPSFLSKQPIDYLTLGEAADVPVVLGVVSGEGLLFLQEDLNKLNKFNETLEDFIPREIMDKLNSEKIQLLDQKIRKSYFGNEKVSIDTIHQLVDIRSDFYFVYPVHRLANLLTSRNTSPVYFYYFDYIGQRAYLDSMFKGEYNLKFPQTVHAGELAYLFDMPLVFPAPEANTPTSDFVDKMTSLWTNFSKKGTPTPDSKLGVKWDRFSPEYRNYLNIGVPLTSKTNLLAKRMKFWDNLYKHHGLPVQ